MPYNCSFCINEFSLLAGLKKHKRIHTSGKPYNCEDCEKSFLITKLQLVELHQSREILFFAGKTHIYSLIISVGRYLLRKGLVVVLKRTDCLIYSYLALSLSERNVNLEVRWTSLEAYFFSDLENIRTPGQQSSIMNPILEVRRGTRYLESNLSTMSIPLHLCILELLAGELVLLPGHDDAQVAGCLDVVGDQPSDDEPLIFDCLPESSTKRSFFLNRNPAEMISAIEGEE